METVKLTKVVRSTTNKAGDALKTKDGRPYTRLSIKTVQHGDKWLSGFDNKDTASWKKGDEVEIEVTTNGEYLNFKTPKKGSIDSEMLSKMDDKLEMILNRITGIKIAVDVLYERTKPTKPGVPDSAYPQESPETAFDDFDEGSVPF